MSAPPPASRRLHPELPVFAVETARGAVVYVPGLVATAGGALIERLAAHWAAGTRPPDGIAAALERRAREVEAHWGVLAAAVLEPRCLSLHLPYACQLACAYCFARPPQQAPGSGSEDAGVGEWSEPALRAAAAGVAAACARAGEPFTLAIQGAGEPTLFWRSLERIVELTRPAAAAHGIPWTGHITTNGQCPASRIEWLAEQFDSVTLSCDGPPERQDRLRPRRDGAPSSDAVARGARILSRRARHFAVRATVRAEEPESLAALVEYAARDLGSPQLRVELGFRRAAGRASAAEDPPAALAERFVAAWAAAEARAAELGLRLGFSGVRLDELHGPYCDEARGVLRIAPDGARLPCFLGAVPDGDAVPAFLPAREALRPPPRCRDCFNQYHCAKSCPDECPSERAWSPAAELRCLIQGGLARHWIGRAAPAERGYSSNPS